MKSHFSKQWLIVALYAMAMAWIEAAAVYYLRTLVGRIDPYQPNPLPLASGIDEAELIREIATLVMLFTVGWLAGATWRSRMGYSLVAFGIWDIFYYVFLRILSGWPTSLFDWDILFLIPLPWWGPVLAPVMIAVVMILFGTIVSRYDAVIRPLFPSHLASGAAIAGVVLSLYVFMADAVRVAGEGEAPLRNVLPTEFNWMMFSVALLLMWVPVGEMAWRAWREDQGGVTTS